MILADKIIKLRKQRGWSQEQLAEMLNVSRQSVSKWEGGLSIPDLDKIIKMSSLFGVSTDYLLKDEVEEIQPATTEKGGADGLVISMEEAAKFMEIKEKLSSKTALAVAMFILCPVPLILLGALSEGVKMGITEDMAGGLGMAILLVMVAIGVVITILNEMQLSKYEYIGKEEFTLEYGVKGIVERKMEDYAQSHRTSIAGGVALCITAVVPMMLAVALSVSDFVMACMVCVLLTLIAIATYLMVRSSNINDSYLRLLQLEDFTPEKKYIGKKLHTLTVVYFCIVTAAYLAISFATGAWSKTWAIWPVAAVLYMAVESFATAQIKKNK
ncbi:MAG: helix-turn-helix transcriptional regulator [Oscillospiraceae bacterium]|nr:helix-turn-helix transcriptional regulator [Oscillospiraceae bacterium]